MVLVIRKKVIIIAIIALVLVGGINVATGNTTEQTSALPVANKVVVLDAGHGGEDGGAVGTGGTVEKDINLAVMTKLQKLLEQTGCIVMTTRTEDKSLHNRGDEKTGNRKMSDLNKRKAMPGDYNSDIFVSIHMNTFTDAKYKGAQVFYAPEPESSKALAECIQAELKQQVDGSNEREVKDASGNIYVLKDVTVPSVVAECGFLSNSDEEKRLNDDAYQQKLAFAIYCGIIKYFAM
ncbi:MAG: N-acetylmuramoyl-L-alanine amidase CwlD [Bacillota bacterium]|nr:N-acetylmuramoyl-L-alanine amidase CwlD [Bacillota bacterium]